MPLWETQLAQAVTIQRSKEAAVAVKQASDLTNELLEANARNLQETNRVVRQEMERGVFDIETVKRANQTLIDTINESLAIADEGKARRAAAEADLQKMEAELRDTLAAAAPAPPPLQPEDKILRPFSHLTPLAAALLVAACVPVDAPAPPASPPPKAAPAPLPKVTAKSEAARAYYAQVQQALLSEGLLRTDGGGEDTPFDDRMLAENFLRIALYDEYSRQGGGFVRSETPSVLRKWQAPVRVGLRFGASVPDDRRATDRARVASYLARLSQLTGHPIALTDGSPNFWVHIVSEDEREALGPTLSAHSPAFPPLTLPMSRG